MTRMSRAPGRGGRDDDSREDEPGWGIISLGALAHGAMSLRGALRRRAERGRRGASAALAGAAGARLRREPVLAPRPPPAGRRFRRRRPRPTTRADEPSRRVAAPPAPPKPGKRISREAQPSLLDDGDYQLPALQLLAEPKKAQVADRLGRRARAERHPARRRRSRISASRRDHQRAPRPGGHALRARAGARHQVLARDLARRRHRPLDERGLGPRRRGAGPQRHRHRAAEPQARDGLPARAPGQPGFRDRPSTSSRSASARPSAASR